MAASPLQNLTDLERCKLPYKASFNNRHTKDLRELLQDHNHAHPDNKVAHASSLNKNALCDTLVGAGYQVNILGKKSRSPKSRAKCVTRHMNWVKSKGRKGYCRSKHAKRSKSRSKSRSRSRK